MSKMNFFIMLVCLTFSISLAQQRSIVRFGTDVTVDSGQQVRDAVAIGGNVEVAGEVTNDAVAVGGDVILHPQAIVGGNAVAVGGQIQRAADAVITGDIVEITAPWRMHPERWVGVFIGLRILAFLGFLALGLLAVALFSRQLQQVSLRVKQETGKSFLWGILVLVAVIPATFLLVISIIGIVLIPLLYIVLILAVFAGYIAVAVEAGAVILGAAGKKHVLMIWKALTGIVVLGIIGFIPFLGTLIGAIVSIIGLGAVIETLIKSRAGKIKADENK